MRRLSLPLLLTALVLSACAHVPEAPQQERPPPRRVGLVRSVDPETLALQEPGSTQPRLFQRTTQTQVVQAGETAGWAAIAPGLAVRVQAVDDVFGPPRLDLVEILAGAEAAAVRNEVEQAPSP